jgi:hypothetical protein
VNPRKTTQKIYSIFSRADTRAYGLRSLRICATRTVISPTTPAFLLKVAAPPPIFKLLYVQEIAMEGAAVDVRIDSRHLFVDLSDGRAAEFPLDWFPVLQAATVAEREHFAISMDRQQVFWPEIDEDVNVPALLSFVPDRTFLQSF